MIYLIYCQQTKCCKLGYSSNPDNRLKELQTGNSFKLSLLHIQEGTIQEEKNIHSKLSEYKLNGEWYEYFRVKDSLPNLLKDWTPVEMDYTQVYHHIFKHTKNLKSRYCLQYILWIINKANSSNMIPHNPTVLQEFCNEFEEKPSVGTIKNAITELIKAKIFIKYSAGSYQLNPEIFWSEDTAKRIQHLKDLQTNDVDFQIIEETILLK